MGVKRTKEEILIQYKQYKKESEEILDAFSKKDNKGGNRWFLTVKCLKHNNIFTIRTDGYKRGSTGCLSCIKKQLSKNAKKEKKQKTKEEVLKECCKYKRKNEKVLNAFKKEYGTKGRKCWFVKIKCLKHNYIYETSYSNYKKCGCKKCGQEKSSQTKILQKEEIEEEFKNNLKNEDELIKVYRKTNDLGKQQWYGKIRCKKHGIFETTKNNYVDNNYGCWRCGVEQRAKKHTLSKDTVKKDFEENLKENEELIKICQKKDNNGWNHWYATLLCKKCNTMFEISKSHHKAGKGCPKCSSSKGESKIRKYLINNNIDFSEQYRFKDCKYKLQLPFDFYIPSLNLAIEYQGEQHYKPIEVFGGEEAFKKQQRNDKIKKEYCQKNNIKLLEIPYTEYDNIEKILNKELKT